MKIAIYHGLDTIHNEMLGYIYEYFKFNKFEYNIYAHLINGGDEWYTYYNNHFNINIIWHNPLTFNPDNYDFIIILTDDDYTFSNEWINKYNNKIILINHFHENRRLYTKYTIGTRFFYTNPSSKWALPSYIGIDKNTKLKLLNNQNRINVTCIGIQNRPPSVQFLKDLFSNFDNINFNIIARSLLDIYNGYSNIFTFVNPSPQIMFDIVKSSEYILCIEYPINPHPKSNSMSGAIPISFSYGCQLIIPELWQRYYNFKNVISYQDNHVQNNGHTILELTKNINIDLIYNELYNIISHRNNVFDNILIGNNINFNNNSWDHNINYNNNSWNHNINYNNNSWYHLLCKLFNFKVPLIFMNINYNNTIYDFNNIKNDFREIHIINDNIHNNNIFSITDYIFTYNNSELNNLIYNINNNMIIYISNINENVFNDIKLLGKRNYSDILIFDILNDTDITNIINIYNKYCIHYIIDNKVIIISQI